MRLIPIALVLAACGGGPSVGGAEPDVAIRSRLCNVESSALVVVNVTYDVTLDVGQAFEASVSIGGAGMAQNSSFSCFSWSSTFAGSQDVGCQRDSFDQPVTVTVEHFFNATLPDVPTQFTVALLGSALDRPLSDVMIANASENVSCSVPPTM